MGFWHGYSYRGSEEKAKTVNTSTYCPPGQNTDSYVAMEGEDFVCFKENINTHRITKSLIVIGNTQ